MDTSEWSVGKYMQLKSHPSAQTAPRLGNIASRLLNHSQHRTLFQVSPKKYSKPNNEYNNNNNNNNNNNQELEVKEFFKIFMWFFCPHPKWSVCFKPKVLWTKRVQGDRWNKIKEPLKAPAMHRPAPRTSLNANPRVRSWWWWPGSQVFAWKSRDKWQIQG